MKIIYLGPSPEVNVGGFEPHRQGEVREYPVAVGEDLLRSAKQRFEKYVENGIQIDAGDPPSAPVKADVSGMVRQAHHDRSKSVRPEPVEGSKGKGNR